VTDDAIRLCLFPFSLLEKAKQWFYAKLEMPSTDWISDQRHFLQSSSRWAKPMPSTQEFRASSSRMMRADESIPEAWERFQEYITMRLHHGMQGWFLIQTFYHGLKHTTREHLDATAGGAFFSLQVPATKELIEKMVPNQGWDGDRLQPRIRGVHQVDRR
jgi:hypothetical protein